MSINFKAQLEGKEILTRAFRSLTDQIDDFRPAFEAAQDKFFEAEKDNFATDNRTGRSGAWQPLSEKYAARKVRSLGFAGFIGLERYSDRLYKSLTGKDAPDSISRITNTTAEFGTSVPYAKAQHFGYKPRNLPARPLIDLSGIQVEAMASAMQKATVRQLKKSGFAVTESNFG
jgi:phage gpG-like protein